MMTADEALNEYIRRLIVSGEIDYIDAYPIAAKERQDVRDHLKECPSLAVTAGEGESGGYGCDTGCDYARLEAEARCEHMGPYDVNHGWFGEFSDIYDELDAIRKESSE